MKHILSNLTPSDAYTDASFEPDEEDEEGKASEEGKDAAGLSFSMASVYFLMKMSSMGLLMPLLGDCG